MQSQGASFTYDAFLSYSHRDGAVASGIQKGLHRIGRRVGQLNALRVFRDATELAANPDLWGKVTDAMDRSRYLIVVLSPQAAASEWVNKEVAHWLQRQHFRSIRLVTNDIHMRRARFEIENKVGAEVTIVSDAVSTDSDMRQIFIEYNKYLLGRAAELVGI